jgi:DDE family transposase
MTDDTIPLFSFPAVEGKKVTAAFDGGRMSSDGGVMLLSLAERRLGVAQRLARFIPDRRDPSRIAHTIADMIRARVFAICCGYEDADDLDVLRSDPAFKLACGRLPDSGRDLCSQPTVSRLENAPGLKDVIRLTSALVDQWMASYEAPPSRVTLDIDDTCDVAHGHQQLSLFNAHYDERCFLPIHVYDTEKRPSRRGHLTPRQDAVGRRGSRPSAPARAPHPLALAFDPRPFPRRWALRPARGDDLVRREQRRLRLRPSRHEALIEES